MQMAIQNNGELLEMCNEKKIRHDIVVDELAYKGRECEEGAQYVFIAHRNPLEVEKLLFSLIEKKNHGVTWHFDGYLLDEK